MLSDNFFSPIALPKKCLVKRAPECLKTHKKILLISLLIYLYQYSAFPVLTIHLSVRLFVTIHPLHHIVLLSFSHKNSIVAHKKKRSLCFPFEKSFILFFSSSFQHRGDIEGRQNYW